MSSFYVLMAMEVFVSFIGPFSMMAMKNTVFMTLDLLFARIITGLRLPP